MIDEEVRKLVDDCFACAIKLLTEHKSELTTLAEMLLDREVIFKEDVEKILGPRGKGIVPLAIAGNN